MAGTLRAEVNLAAANGLYLILLLLGGMIVPISKLPSGLAGFAKMLAGGGAVSRIARRRSGRACRCPASPGPCWRVWAVAAPVAAALTFRWE